jgi:polysaccharide biosynthesis/export protein
MQRFRNALMLLGVTAVAVFSALNWRAQLQTQQKLDAIASALAERSAVAPAPAAAPELQPIQIPAPGVVPRELDKITLPPYVIEAPDVLTIEVAVKDPKTGKPDRLPEQPVSGAFLVRPDGTVGLGLWGSVEISGLTTEQAVTAIRKHLAKFAEKVPADALTVTVDVVSYNSKRYYVITDADGGGEQVIAFPLAGRETALDAITNSGGVPRGKRSIWVARRGPNAGQPWQTLPVDWAAITQLGDTTTNYQLLPGDRVYVKRTAD